MCVSRFFRRRGAPKASSLRPKSESQSMGKLLVPITVTSLILIQTRGKGVEIK
jgi:hypothetical protein